MASVPYGDTFLLVGGTDYHSGESQDTIYVFDSEAEAFHLLEGRSLQTARSHHTAMLVDAYTFVLMNATTVN